jgi:hypothetical protein
MLAPDVRLSVDQPAMDWFDVVVPIPATTVPYVALGRRMPAGRFLSGACADCCSWLRRVNQLNLAEGARGGRSGFKFDHAPVSDAARAGPACDVRLHRRRSSLPSSGAESRSVTSPSSAYRELSLDPIHFILSGSRWILRGASKTVRLSAPRLAGGASSRSRLCQFDLLPSVAGPTWEDGLFKS